MKDSHVDAIRRSQITQLAPNKVGFFVDALNKYCRMLRPGTSITLTSDAVIVHIGKEEFLLNPSPYELEADLEAVHRLMKRRVPR